MTSKHRKLSDGGLRAAVQVARELGLPVAQPRVLSERGNVLVQFAPAPVLARVATLTAWTRRRPLDWLDREVRVATLAAARGGPVVRPSELVAPGPYEQDGFVLTCWEYLDPTPGLATAAETAAKLAELHAATSCEEASLPRLTPVYDQIDDALHALESAQVLSAGTLAALREHHATVLAELDGAGSADIVLHGDAHAGNLLRTGRGWVWTDLEETCTGPPEWDLAVLIDGTDLDISAALESYAAASGWAVPSEDELAPFSAARDLEATVWLLSMAHLHPDRYHQPARDRLAALGLGSG